MADSKEISRICTTTLNFLKKEGGRPPASDVFLFVTKNLRRTCRDLEGVEEEFGGSRVHLKFKRSALTEEVIQDMLSNRKRKMKCEDGSERTVILTVNGQQLITMKIRNLPIEVSTSDMCEALEEYGDVLDSERDRYGEGHPFCGVWSGVRTVTFEMRKHIPNFINICGWTVFVEYPGQPRTCSVCSSTDHLRSKCPEKRRKKHEVRERQHETEEPPPADDSEAEPEPSGAPPLLPPPPAASEPSADVIRQPSPPPADVTAEAGIAPTCKTQPQQHPVSKQTTGGEIGAEEKRRNVERWKIVEGMMRSRSLSRKREASGSPEGKGGVKTRSKKPNAKKK